MKIKNKTMKIKNKKGQIMGLPLVLVFALIVAGLLLFFGVRWILSLQGAADSVAALDMIDSIDNYVETYGSYDARSARRITVSFPTSVEVACFYDKSQSYDCKLDGGDCTQDLENYFQLLGTSSSNIFLFPTNSLDETRFSITSFQSEGANPVCVSNGNDIQITTHEDYVSISYVESA